MYSTIALESYQLQLWQLESCIGTQFQFVYVLFSVVNQMKIDEIRATQAYIIIRQCHLTPYVATFGGVSYFEWMHGRE